MSTGLDQCRLAGMSVPKNSIGRRMFEDEVYRLMGAAFEVYNVLGYGMAEEIYQQSLEIELTLRQIPFVPKQQPVVFYKDRPLETLYKPDLFAFGGIVIELKAVSDLTSDHVAQLFNNMRIARQPVGNLINFGRPNDLEWKRFILSDLHWRGSAGISVPPKKRIETLIDANEISRVDRS
ncbi:MAG: GxxExxY protein [Planctomycetaceae bacterium]